MTKKTKASPRFNQKQGRALVSLARKTLLERFGFTLKSDDENALATVLKEKKFQNKLASFVTLNKEGELRGCIGSLEPTETVVDGIKRNTINAAFHDHRFPPVGSEELDEIGIEVNVLTDPTPVEYADGNDLITKLQTNVDGVIIRKGAARATFLPQVWEQLPEPEDFLTQLCMKAGLAPDSWQTTKLDVLVYQVQHFEEKK